MLLIKLGEQARQPGSRVTYFRVMYQVLRIPIVREIRDTEARFIPLAVLAIAVALGILLVLMLITGPYSRFHVPR